MMLVIIAGCGSTATSDDGASVEDKTSTGYGNNDNSANTNTGGYNQNPVSGEGFNGMSAEEVAALRQVRVFYFEFDSSDLKPDAMRALDVHAHDLKQNGRRIVLDGHTDDRGTREYNMALGERRAKAVKRYLTMQDVPGSQIEVVSYGKERPAVSGNDESAWALNRRVELRFD